MKPISLQSHATADERKNRRYTSVYIQVLPGKTGEALNYMSSRGIKGIESLQRTGVYTQLINIVGFSSKLMSYVYTCYLLDATKFISMMIDDWIA